MWNGRGQGRNRIGLRIVFYRITHQFHNGAGRPAGDFSTIEEIAAPVDASGNYVVPQAGQTFGPTEAQVVYRADPSSDFYSSFIGGSQRLPNGNTLICYGAHGTFFEVDSNREVLWRYVSPVTNEVPLAQGEPIPALGTRGLMNAAFRTTRYPPSYPGFDGKVLTPQGSIELVTGITDLAEIPRCYELQQNFPNPFNPSTMIRFRVPARTRVTVTVYNVLGEKVAVLLEEQQYEAGVTRSCLNRLG